MEEDLLRELDESESDLSVVFENRKFNKPVTIVRGIASGEREMKRVASELKKRLAVGGTVKDREIILQGNHTSTIEQALSSLGFRKVRVIGGS